MSLWKPLDWFLVFKSLRRRMAFQLKYRYFNDLEIEIPIGEGLIATLPYIDSSDSFSEIMLQGEYCEFLNKIELPRKWIDIGCHMGYFSLYVERERRQAGITTPSHAILIDADSRTCNTIPHMISRNKLEDRWVYQNAAIGVGKFVTFYENDYMSSTTLEETGGRPVKIAICNQEEVQRMMPGDYDLVKIDVEGSEWDFLDSYQSLVEKSQHLLLEWHSWHSGGGGVQQLRQRLQDLNFSILHEGTALKVEGEGREVGLIIAKKNERFH